MEPTGVAARVPRSGLRRLSPTALAVGGGFALWLAMLAASLAAFLFHVIVSRRLVPADYGALGALLGVLMVLAVPASALQVVITRAVAVRRAGSDSVVAITVGPLLAQAVAFGVVMALVLIVLSPFLQSVFRVPTLPPAIMVGLWTVPTAIGVVPRGVLLGEMRFRPVAVALVVGAVLRLVLGAALVDVADGLTAAMAATVLAELAVTLILLGGLRDIVVEGDGFRPVGVHWSEAAGAIGTLTGFWLLTTVDTWVARRLLAPAASGFYTAAATAARAALFLPAAVAIVAFPRFAATRGRGPAARGALVATAAVVAALSFGAAAGLSVFHKQIVTTLFGEGYAPAAELIGILGLSSAFLGMVGLLAHFHLAAERRITPALSWVGAAAIVAISSGRSLSDQGLAMLTVGVTAAVALVMAWVAFAGGRTAPRHEATGDLWLPESGTDLTVVVPYYNPGPTARGHVEAMIGVLETTGRQFELVTVSDGSTDQSAEAVALIEDVRVRHVVLGVNQGKGAALRVGMAMGRGRYVGFVDADGEIDPEILRQFANTLDNDQPDVILASKRHPLSVVDYPRMRRVYSWGYQQLVRGLFRLNVRETQTGAKLIRREVLADVLPRMLEKRFAFDLELLAVARRLGYTTFLEVPVNIEHRFASTVSWRSVRGMLLDTMAIFYRLRILRWYDDIGRTA